MSGAPVEPAALVDAVTRAVRIELDSIVSNREVALVDFEAERTLLAALLAEFIDHDGLPPLEAKHFGSAVHGALWELLRHTTTLPGLVAGLRERGHTGAVSEMLLEIECDVPVYPPGYLAEQAARVRDLWRRRTFVTELKKQAALVSAELIDPTETAEPLRRVYTEVRK